MKQKFLLFAILVFIGLYVPVSYSQITFTCKIANDTLYPGNVYEFDIYLLSTGTSQFRLFGAQFDLTFNNAVLNGGTLTAVVIDQSWDPVLDASGQAPNNCGVYTGDLNMAPMIAGGNRFAAVISSVAPGTKVGRVKLTNSVGFASQNLNLAFQFIDYGTRISAYTSAVLTNNTAADISANGSFINSLSNPTLPVELASFKSNVSGRQVNLNWETKTEVNTRQFEIDRALVSTKDATVTWASVGILQASGTSTTTRKYSYTDKNLQAGKYQYRLKMIDNDGSYKLSDVVETEITLPKNFELSQNYPNPFNPSTRINYSLPFDSRVTLEVYNITGERMGQIVSEEQSAGYYTVNFSSSNFNRSIASGVYIYKISAVNKSTGNVFTSIKKMMLLK
jgi:hypothetical protein